MDSNLKATLRKRINENKCLICNREYQNKKEILQTTLFLHTIFGDTQICEKHIKKESESSEESKGD